MGMVLHLLNDGQHNVMVNIMLFFCRAEHFTGNFQILSNRELPVIQKGHTCDMCFILFVTGVSEDIYYLEYLAQFCIALHLTLILDSLKQKNVLNQQAAIINILQDITFNILSMCVCVRVCECACV